MLSTGSAGVWRILVVDDTKVNRVILEARLRERGCTVVSAASGREALQILKDSVHGDPFDAVLLDIMMPEIDGLQVLRELRKTHSSIDLPVIMVTAKEQTDDIVAALETGANDYVTKPIDIPVLLARLRAHIALKGAHASLMAAQQSLVRAAKMETIRVLASGVAHEIRNPLAQIQLGLDSMRDSSPDHQDSIYLDVMQTALERADLIVRRLMDASSSSRLQLQSVDVARLICDTLEMLDNAIASAGITIETSFAPHAPPALVSIGEFQQVILNLLSNAVDAMPEGGTLTARTRAELVADAPLAEGARTGDRLRDGDPVLILEILDTGPGIPPDQLERIFDAFYSGKPAGKGAGLGLAVSWKMLDLHGGRLEVENRRDRSGVCVRATLRTTPALIS